MMKLSSKRFSMATLLCCVAIFATIAKPRQMLASPPQSLDELIPRAFADWHVITNGPQAIDPNQDTVEGHPDADSPYDEVLLRTYSNSRGEVLQLALAYGRQQRQEVKIHRPELCYIAQGFKISSRQPALFKLGSGSSPTILTGAHMVAEAPGRVEVVSYWLRVGDLYSDDPWTVRYHILREGLHGRIDDGILVRVSQIVPRAEGYSNASYELQGAFLSALLESIPTSTRRLLIA